MGNTKTYTDVMKMLAQNYEEIEHSIVNQLMLNVFNHYLTEGMYREGVWKSLFEMIIPKKYCIEQGVFIIDSYGNKSKEVDLAIYDELYTPYIFNYENVRFIPIEAVAAVVQCKSNGIESEDILEWAESIDKLLTSLDSVTRMATGMTDNYTDTRKVTQTATRPIKILCALAENITNEDLKKEFDIILTVDKDKKKLIKFVREEDSSLNTWNCSLNHAMEGTEPESRELIKEKADRQARIFNKEGTGNARPHLLQDLKIGQDKGNGVEENVLLSLIFQLNQLLMVLNNPMLFPHRAYADTFNRILNGYDREQGEGHGQEKEHGKEK